MLVGIQSGDKKHTPRPVKMFYYFKLIYFYLWENVSRIYIKLDVSDIVTELASILSDIAS